MIPNIFQAKADRLVSVPSTATIPCIAALLMGLMFGLLCSEPASAQVFTDPVDWKEAGVPPPPVYDVSKLLPFEVARSSSLAYGVDPGTFTISKADGVVRYVIVASSPSGAKNVIYEGLRCATGEVKSYARANQDGAWAVVKQSEWKWEYL